MDNRFRSAALGGFNRKDVIDYVQRAAQEHEQAIEQLNARLAELNARLDEANSRAEQAQQAMEALTAERDECRRTAQETAARADMVPGLEAQVQTLREQVARLEPDAAAYTAIKERAAGMELEAHQRAQAIVDRAGAQSAEVREQTRQWVMQVRREYDEMRLLVESTVSRAGGELDRVRQGLGNISLCLDRQTNAIDQLVRASEQDSE